MKWELISVISSLALAQAAGQLWFKASATDDKFEDLWLRVEEQSSTEGFGNLVESTNDRSDFQDPDNNVNNLVSSGDKLLWIASIDSNNNNELIFNGQDWIVEGGFTLGSEMQLQVDGKYSWIFCEDKDDGKNHVYFEGDFGSVTDIPDNCARGVLAAQLIQ